jgi:hypothetical protein
VYFTALLGFEPQRASRMPAQGKAHRRRAPPCVKSSSKWRSGGTPHSASSGMSPTTASVLRVNAALSQSQLSMGDRLHCGGGKFFTSGLAKRKFGCITTLAVMSAMKRSRHPLRERHDEAKTPCSQGKSARRFFRFGMAAAGCGVVFPALFVRRSGKRGSLVISADLPSSRRRP